ncbi:MAG: hypothetical protein ACLFVW_01185 [Phycisphaerae bacterium]
MRQASVIMAVIGFFVVALVGTISGVEPHVCSLRALAGAAVMYILARVCGGLVVRVVADAAIRGMNMQQQKGSSDNSGE